MAGPLALVGGDELHPGNEPQDALLAEAAGAGPAYVMATAAARHRPELAAAHAHEWFARFGLDVAELPVRTKTQARSADTAALARDGTFFYLVGGDPGIVPDVLGGSLVWQAVVEAWLGGAALAGSSAGAMALGAVDADPRPRPGGPRTSVPRRARAGAERRRAAALRHVRPGVGGVCLGRPSVRRRRPRSVSTSVRPPCGRTGAGARWATAVSRSSRRTGNARSLPATPSTACLHRPRADRRPPVVRLNGTRDGRRGFEDLVPGRTVLVIRHTARHGCGRVTDEEGSVRCLQRSVWD